MAEDSHYTTSFPHPNTQNTHSGPRGHQSNLTGEFKHVTLSRIAYDIVIFGHHAYVNFNSIFLGVHIIVQYQNLP